MRRSDDLTLWTAKTTAVACSLAAAVYAAVQVDASPIATLFISFGPLIAVILWLQKDARRTGVVATLDWGVFLWIAWPLVIPWYAWRTRGRPGWHLTLGLFGLILSPSIASLVAAWLAYGVRYALWYFKAGR
jgi:hypothetical protein